MAANRGLVGVVALAVLVWGIAFGGGLTVAVLTSSVNVTATFETADNLTAIDDSSGDGFVVATAAVGNVTGEPEETGGPENGSAPSENVSAPPENVSAPPENVTSPPENVTAPPENDSAPPGNASSSENVSVPSDDPITNGSAPPEEETAPSENGSATPEDETVPQNETTTETDDSAPSASEPTGNATAETAPALRGDAPESVSIAVHWSVGLPSLFASEA